MDKIDEFLLSELSQGISLTAKPFNNIAVKLGISSEEVLTRLVKLKQAGVIRRFGATLKPNNIGLIANAVIAWRVPSVRTNEVGKYFSSFSEVTHCYERSTVQGCWEYNMYIVMHAQEQQIIEQRVKSLAKTIGIFEYVILYSKRDLKHR
ncbi:MAG: Lrp/AsnC family transcriptional regulator [Nitrososphaerota archaeon]|uniref:siroheme decarboxylase subunit beta n=1 Tax=Candidatus Bathycorpusculum sp. TaxID=2994959 RepID=UPI002834C3B5|nr:Lrp/AsnC family transcriptional regulator [Candidatus Termiticorpusculum sp.]MCL2257509.1 Lrp/AsnC family transcriptional regulator [Candidatus Termiticorpusculum sp.]MCL2292351.1 Lrp/AsnC family transcriptional regulator [Candidatus Termiticorpusculum sp.]MDR0461245.1 Lrp/AsnC family transcriptional regulator [Nitrososphaerota archaeon]